MRKKCIGVCIAVLVMLMVIGITYVAKNNAMVVSTKEFSAKESSSSLVDVNSNLINEVSFFSDVNKNVSVFSLTPITYEELGIIKGTITKEVVNVTPKVVGGRQYFIVLKADGTVYGWGNNDYGQLGLGDTNTRRTPTKLNIDGVIDIAAGGSAIVALKSDGTVWACGDNHYGQLGNGTSMNSSEFVQVKKAESVYLDNIVQISAGDGGRYALSANGDVYSWGRNESGQLGSEIRISLLVYAQKMPNVENIMQVSAYDSHVLMLSTDGTVWACGDNYYGQLGDESRDDHRIAKQVVSEDGKGILTGVKEVSAGMYYSMFLKSDGTVWACGYNYHGQLGNGTRTTSKLIVQAKNNNNENITNAKHIIGGYDASVILTDTDEMYVSGKNSYGQLFIEDTTNITKFTLVETSKPRISQIFICEKSAIMVDTEGYVYTVGDNNSGQLGNGTTDNSVIPTRIGKPKLILENSLIKLRNIGDTKETKYNIEGEFNLINDTIPVNDGDITFTSEDTSVATVDSNGVVTAKANGMTFIRIYYNTIESYERVGIIVGTQPKVVTVNSRIAKKVSDTEYTIDVVRGTTNVDISAILYDSLDYVSIDGNEPTIEQNTKTQYDLSDGNTITIVVSSALDKTEQDYEEKQYTLTITQVETKEELEDLQITVEVNDNIITETEDGLYIAQVDVLDELANVIVNTTSNSTKIKIEDSEFTYEMAERQILVDSKEVKVIITVENADNQQVQKQLWITKPYEDEEDAIINKLEADGAIVLPQPDGTYTIRIPNATNALMLKAIAKQQLAYVTINSDTATRGTSTKTIDVSNINLSMNKIKIESISGNIKEYTVVIDKNTYITGKVITDTIDKLNQNALITVYTAAEPKTKVLEQPINGDGTYIVKLTPEEYDIVVTKKSYLEYRVNNVEVKDGEDIELEDIRLYSGDINSDGEIELEDLVLFNTYVRTIRAEDGVPEFILEYDLNGDNKIDELDREIIKANYAKKLVNGDSHHFKFLKWGTEIILNGNSTRKF